MSVFMVRKRGKFFRESDRSHARSGPATPFGQILPNEKERLDRADLADPSSSRTRKKYIKIVLGQGRADQLIETVVLALVAKGLVPGRAVRELRQGDDRGKAVPESGQEWPDGRRRMRVGVGRRAQLGMATQ